MGHRFAQVYTDKVTSGKKISYLEIDGVYSEVTIEYWLLKIDGQAEFRFFDKIFILRKPKIRIPKSKIALPRSTHPTRKVNWNQIMYH